jgi:hypothetical protein
MRKKTGKRLELNKETLTILTELPAKPLEKAVGGASAALCPSCGESAQHSCCL